MRLIAKKDGFVGVTLYRQFLPKGDNSTIEDYADAIEYTLNIVGEDQVGFGTDFTQEQGSHLAGPRQGLCAGVGTKDRNRYSLVA